MSKLAKKPLSLPGDMEVEAKDQKLVFKGVKGEVTLKVPSTIKVERVKDTIKIEGKNSRILGLFTALVKNAICGVSKGFRKELELVGVGYKAEMVGDILKLALGFPHPIEYRVQGDVKVTTEGKTRIIVEGVDKQKVGQVAAEIRKFRLPEPYKGKGIRYVGEMVRRKPGKAMKAMVGVGGA